MTDRRVVGLDLSLTATGWANSSGIGIVGTKLKGCQRLAALRDLIVRQVKDDFCWDESVPTTNELWPLVVIEGYSFGSRNSHAHALGELGGIVRVALYELGAPYVDVPPSSLKKYATGKGNAGKEEVLAAAIRRLGYEGHDNNEADALWLQAMGYDALGCPVVEMPAVNRAALAKVAWPEAVA